MSIKLIAIAALLGCAAPALAQQPTVQQQFDHGQKLLEAGKADEAARLYEGLEQRLAALPKPPSQSLAIVRTRLAESLLRSGERERALPMLAAALPMLSGEPNRLIRGDALRTLAQAEEAALDFAAAAGHYREAATLAEREGGALPIALAAAAARVTIPLDPRRAASELALIAPKAQAIAKAEPEAAANYLDLLARAHMNAGDYAQADVAAQQALKLAGGLSARDVSLTDVAVRWDAALIAWRLGKPLKAAEYVRYTGVGTGKGQDLTFPADLLPPPCDGEGGLKPDDTAIVQFTLDADGNVTGAAPIWSNRTGEVALEFARAVLNWTWEPKAAAAITPFFRIAPRVQLRCSQAPERIELTRLALPELNAWMALLSVDPTDPAQSTNPRGMAQSLRTEIAAETGRDERSPRLPALLYQLARTSSVNRADKFTLLDRAYKIARVSGVPAEPLAYLGVVRANRIDRPFARATQREQLRALRELASEPRVAASPRAAAYVGLRLAQLLSAVRDRGEARLALSAILSRSGLTDSDPIRQAAAIRLASMEAAAGRIADAEALFRKSGLDPSQCSLLDQEPARLRTSASTADYPEGVPFNGYIVTEFDITAEGRTRAIRTVFSYPPDFFNEATTKIVSRSVYARTYRPENGIGCSGYRDRVRFLLWQ